MADIALAQDVRTGAVVMHRADCPAVRKMADDGHPVATLFGCDTVPDDLPRHTCLTEGKHDG